MCTEHFSTILWLLDCWWRGEQLSGAIIMSILMAGLRIAYFNGNWKKIILEATLCGLLTMTISSTLDHFEFQRSLSITVGGVVGLIGVGCIRSIVMKLIKMKFNISDK
ncbi:phage holin, lambda family [Rosenbergiella sp. S61]|uniref:Phage holin, lambda family n=1 Tax=Rosenbergiella gaditana TaxID=2726987 RepID=A0ABS5T1K5_9GAMM|nr:phage holin, lambda family [Rosenbergiella gaditana]MBT0724888.1 phage holin, lambda family [Rosenbergiella gaditana]